MFADGGWPSNQIWNAWREPRSVSGVTRLEAVDTAGHHTGSDAVAKPEHVEDTLRAGR